MSFWYHTSRSFVLFDEYLTKANSNSPNIDCKGQCRKAIKLIYIYWLYSFENIEITMKNFKHWTHDLVSLNFTKNGSIDVTSKKFKLWIMSHSIFYCCSFQFYQRYKLFRCCAQEICIYLKVTISFSHQSRRKKKKPQINYDRFETKATEIHNE